MAAAMALSMSAVAFAKDNPQDNDGISQVVTGGALGGNDRLDQLLGESKDYLVDPGVVEMIVEDNTKRYPKFTTDQLAAAMSNGDVTVDVSVTSGKSNLTGLPKVKIGSYNGNPAAILSVEFKDTWGVSSKDASVRIRITAKKDITIGDTYPDYGDIVTLKRGDTITLGTANITADYLEVTAYGDNMTVTNTEVKNKNIKALGSYLYDNAGSDDKVLIYFTNGGYDVAAYEVKIAPNQKDVNLAFDTNEIESITKEFDKVEFEFINFKAQVSGANRFNNSGTMYFNAIGGDDTTIYEVVDGTIDLDNPLNGKYDSVDKTIAVSGIKYLTQYVVASEPLTSEEEPEEEDSSSSAPTDEVPSTPANPSTGAL